MTGFYDIHDNGLFDLNLVTKNEKFAQPRVNHESQDLRKKFKHCSKKCKETDCFREVVIAIEIPYSHYSKYLSKEGKKEKVVLLSTIYSAYYSTDDYYLQLFGLLTLFTGTFFVKLLPALLLLSVEKFKRHHSMYYKFFKIFRLFYPKVKFTITFISFIFILNEGLSMVNELKFKSNYPNKTNTFNFVSDPFSLVVCVPIENAFSRDERSEIYRKKTNIFREYDFKSLEKRSKNFLSTELLSIEAFAGNEPIKTEYSISNEILFKNSTFISKTPILSRCFRLDFELKELRYKTLMPLVCLNFSLNSEYKELFLIDKNRNFVSGLVNFRRGLFSYLKMTKKFSKKSKKSNCRDYSKERDCDSKRNCLERCISRHFIEKHGSISVNTVVNITSLPPFLLNSSIKFNETVDRSIEERCLRQFEQSDCKEVYFEEDTEKYSFEVRNFVLIKLNHLSIVQKEMEYEPAKTILDIISLASIFFGLNVTNVLATGFFLISQTFRLKWHRTYNAVIFLIAGIGFLAHNYLVFENIIKSDLNQNEFFEKQNRYIMPSPVFCFPLPKDEIDENHKFTGEYLDDLTKNLIFEDVFSKLVYYKRTGEHFFIMGKEMNIVKNSNLNFNSYTDYEDPELRLTHFYYSNLKCFKINLKVSYKEEDFYFRDNKTIMNIYFEKELQRSKRIEKVHFFYQFGPNEINGGIINEIRIPDKIRNSTLSYKYKIDFELIKITREDKFEMLKNLRSLFYEKIQVNDVAEYLDKMKRQFKNDYNLTTSDLLLDEHSNLEVDNELFEQFFRQIQNISDHSKIKSWNFEQNILSIFSDIYETDHQKPDFSFSLLFLVKRIEITNNENYTKFVVSFLNSLSLWLNICILDLNIYINQILRLSLYLYYLLIWARNRVERIRS